MPTDLMQMWLGTMGMLSMWVGLTKSNNAVTAVVSFAAALVFFIAFTLGAYQVAVGDVPIVMSFPMVAFVGLASAAASLVLLAYGALRLLGDDKRQRGPRA